MIPVISSRSPRHPFPPDRFPGCLPRRSLPGERCPLAIDRIPIIRREEWADYARQIGGGAGLKPMVRTILDQDGVGSCATEAAAQALMIDRAFRGFEHVPLNPWFMYRITSGGRDTGSSIDDNLVFLREHGCAPESLHPRSLGWRAEPSPEAVEAAKKYRIEEFYDVTSIDEMVSALLMGYPVVYGANGHAVVKVRHIDETKGEDVNSWGQAWGENGFGVWATYRAVDFRYGAWAVRAARAE